MHGEKREEGKALILKELEQLRKSGATLEDQTAQVLREVQEQAAAADRIKQLRPEYFIY